MELNLFQITLLSLLGAISILDSLTFQFGFHTKLIVGFCAGVIVGDVTTGLYIGGTLQLLSLGVEAFGGASVPDYVSASIIGTALVAGSGGELTPEAAITIAIPVGLLLLNFDILARWLNSFIVNSMEKDIEKGNYDKAVKKNLLGILPWGLSRFIPIFIALVLGQQFVTQAVDWINTNIAWLMDGLKVAGGLLPVVGMAILLKFLPIKKYFYFALFGFLLVAYLNVTVTGVALFGLIIAIVMYKQGISKSEIIMPTNTQSMEGDTYEFEE